MLASLSLRSLSVWCGVAVAGLFLGALVQPARSAVFVVPGETYYYGFNSYDPWGPPPGLVTPSGGSALGGDYTSSSGISDSVMKVMNYGADYTAWHDEIGWHDGQSLDAVGGVHSDRRLRRISAASPSQWCRVLYSFGKCLYGIHHPSGDFL